MRHIITVAATAGVLALAACDSSPPHPAAPAAAAPAAATSAAPAATAGCPAQVQSWLADTSLFPNGATLQAGITGVYQDAQQYLSTFAGDPSGDAATAMLSIWGDQNGSDMTVLADSGRRLAGRGHSVRQRHQQRRGYAAGGQRHARGAVRSQGTPQRARPDSARLRADAALVD